MLWSSLPIDTRVNKRYINELRPHLNESDNEDRMTNKGLKEMKVTIYTDNVYLPYGGSTIRTQELSIFCFQQFYVR